jgi:TatA/E family protein of Tat protein translocase
MFGVGPTELFVVCVVVLLLFGNRVPTVMRSLGKGLSEFKHGLNDITKEIDE